MRKALLGGSVAVAGSWCFFPVSSRTGVTLVVVTTGLSLLFVDVTAYIALNVVSSTRSCPSMLPSEGCNIHA